MTKLEADCGRCGDIYSVPDLQSTKHDAWDVNTGRPCDGLPRRVYQLTETAEELQEALLDRAVNSAEVRPLIKYRPSQNITLIEESSRGVVVEELAFGAGLRRHNIR